MSSDQQLLHPRKVAALPLAGDEALKCTNEIEVAVPLLDAIELRGKDITTDALLTQRNFAAYLVDDRGAHYHFTVKGKQPHLLEDGAVLFQQPQESDFVVAPALAHGRVETRKISTTCALNHYLDFPMWARPSSSSASASKKKTGKRSSELACGITSRPPRSKPTPGGSSKQTAATGASRTAATTSSTETSTKTAAGSEPATARKTSP
jgi:predicted transposase YbfD/YdcC